MLKQKSSKIKIIYLFRVFLLEERFPLFLRVFFLLLFFIFSIFINFYAVVYVHIYWVTPFIAAAAAPVISVTLSVILEEEACGEGGANGAGISTLVIL